MSEAEVAAFGGLRRYFLLVSCLALFSLLLGFVGVPLAFIPVASVVVTALYVLVPFLALYVGASQVTQRTRRAIPWALVLVVAGVVLHVGSIALLQLGVVAGLLGALVAALGQVGLITWCLGLGGLLAMLLKDRNMLIPICVFLALFDAFLVLTPVGFTQQIMKQAPKIQTSVSLVVPKVAERPTTGPVAPLAYIGPADLLFAAMFFAVLFKFGMRTRTTLIALVPALVLYLGLALYFGALPALVPIGLCVLIVNWRQFRLNAEEWASTAVIAALGIGLFMWGMSRPRPRPELSPSAPAQSSPAPANSPAPASGGPHR